MNSHYRYYDLDAYHRRKMMKYMKMGLKQQPVERTEFNDEEQRRYDICEHFTILT